MPPPFSPFLMFLQLFRTIFDYIRNWFETCKNQDSTPLMHEEEDEEDVIPGTVLLKLQIFISSQKCFANNFHSSKLVSAFFVLDLNIFFESFFLHRTQFIT